MKKGTILTYAYAFALIFSVLLDYVIKSGVTTKIAIAAALASYFFAIADLYEIKVERIRLSVEESIKMKGMIEPLVTEVEGFALENKKKLIEAKTRMAPYITDLNAKQIVESIEEELKLFCDIETSNNDLKETIFRRESIENNLTNKMKKYKKISQTVLLIGFVLFFILVIFDSISAMFSDSQNVISICAFALVVLCYEAKDNTNEKESISKDLSITYEKALQLKKELILDTSSDGINKNVNDYINNHSENLT